jgi:MFS family permease
VGGALTFLILIGVFYFHPDDGSENHHLIFIYLAAIAWIAAGISFSLIKEQPSVTQVKRSVWTETRQGWKLYRSTPWFRRFFFTRALFLSVGLAIPFYSIHASFDKNAGTQSLSFFILATAVMNIFSGPIWSRMLSRDPCRVLIWSGFIAAVAGGVALIHDIVSGISFEVLYTLVFALAALASSGMTQASATYLALMTPAQDRPRYLAINSAMLGIIAVFISGAMGVLAHNIHIHWALGVLISVTLVASHSATKLKPTNVSAETEVLPSNITDSDLC